MTQAVRYPLRLVDLVENASLFTSSETETFLSSSSSDNNRAFQDCHARCGQRRRSSHFAPIPAACRRVLQAGCYERRLALHADPRPFVAGQPQGPAGKRSGICDDLQRCDIAEQPQNAGGTNFRKEADCEAFEGLLAVGLKRACENVARNLSSPDRRRQVRLAVTPVAAAVHRSNRP